MSGKINVDTQGISDDWMTANGDFDTRSRGTLDEDQVLSALLHLEPLNMPDGDDVCPPHVLIEGPAGRFSFIGQGGTLLCPDLEQEFSAANAADVALGRVTMAPPPPAAPSSAPAQSDHASRAVLPDPNLMTRKLSFGGILLILLGILFFAGAAAAIFGAVSMAGRGVTGDDLWAAWTIGGMSGLIGGLFIAVALKRRSYINENGEVLPYVIMGQMIGNDAFDDDFGDFD